MKIETKIVALVDNVLKLKKDTLELPLLSELRDELRHDNPQYHQMVRMQRRQPHKHQYTEMPPRTIVTIFEDDATVYIPRGCRSLLNELARKYNQTIELRDNRIYFDRSEAMGLVDGFELLPYQKSNIADPIIKEEGVIVAPCGGGKTVLGLAIAMTLGQPTLILVHTHDLLNQWTNELRTICTLPEEVGIVGAGQKVPRYVTVATIQTLTRMDSSTLRKLLGKFGCVILDECHHCPATTFMLIMNLTGARYRYGFTATKERKDGLHFLMHDTIGPVIVAIDDSDLESAGRSQSVQVLEVKTQFYTRYTADEWSKLIGKICQDEARNRLIVENVVQSWHKGHLPLVLSNRVAHCHLLCDALRKEGMNAELLLGSVPKHRRGEICQAARDNLLDVIIATQVADEGLDIPALSCLHLTIPTANRSKIQQRIGRIRRPKNKPSLVYDYIDVKVPACGRMARDRRRYYRNWGFSSVNSHS